MFYSLINVHRKILKEGVTAQGTYLDGLCPQCPIDWEWNWSFASLVRNLSICGLKKLSALIHFLNYLFKKLDKYIRLRRIIVSSNFFSSCTPPWAHLILPYLLFLSILLSFCQKKRKSKICYFRLTFGIDVTSSYMPGYYVG